MNMIREARLRRDLNNVAMQVDHLLTTLSEEGSQGMQTLRDRVADAASGMTAAARDRLASMNSTVTDSARQAAKVTDAYVRENPWRAIGVGAVAGLLIGFLATRR